MLDSFKQVKNEKKLMENMHFIFKFFFALHFSKIQ